MSTNSKLTNENNYNIGFDKYHVSNLVKDWNDTKTKYDATLKRFSELHKYIYFLCEVQKYPKIKVAKLLEVDRTRISHIIKKMKKVMRGGASS